MDMPKIQRLAAATILLLVVAGVVGACSNDSPSAAGADTGSSTTDALSTEGKLLADAPQAEPMYAGTAYDATTTNGGGGNHGSGGGLAGSLDQAPDIGPSVIKTAGVDIEIARDGLQDVTREAVAIAGRLGGFVLSTSTSDDRHASSTMVVRVPSQNFERALAQLEDLGNVKAEQISGEDVGQQFVDLEARLRHLDAQEAVMLRLMDRSATVTDTIRVQHELDGIQLDIERLTGRLRYLRDQTDMGTITASFVEVGAPAARPASGILAKAWERAKDLALGVVAAVIVGTGIIVPLAIIAALGFLVFRAVRPRLSS